jgi:hydroxylamine reductase (hybrid-cluster protein)
MARANVDGKGLHRRAIRAATTIDGSTIPKLPMARSGTWQERKADTIVALKLGIITLTVPPMPRHFPGHRAAIRRIRPSPDR